MKVLLLMPPQLVEKQTFGLLDLAMPLSLAYLGAAVEQAGHEVILYDAPLDEINGCVISNDVGGLSVIGLPLDILIARLLSFNPDVVGVTVLFSSQLITGLMVLEKIKEKRPDIITFMGGAEITLNPLKAMSSQAVDYAIMGEGELSFPQVLNDLAMGHTPRQCPGLVSRTERGIVAYTPTRILDLDALPFPAFHLLPVESYFKRIKRRSIRMYTSRGCTYNCAFCTVPTTGGRRFIAHSPARVMAELDSLMLKYSPNEIVFEDDNMSLNKARFKDILRLIIGRDYGLKLSARNFRCDTLEDDSIKLMAQAGFKKVWLAPESGSKRVLIELMNKTLDPTEVIRTALKIHEAGMTTAAAFIIGTPGETLEEIEQTATMARKMKEMGTSEFWVSVFVPLEGSALFNKLAQAGIITKPLDNATYNYGCLSTKEWTAVRVNNFRNELMEELND